MLPNSLDLLLKSMKDFNADIMGARALYLRDENDLVNLDGFLKRENFKRGELYNLNKLKFNFFLNLGIIQEVPICHACLLIKSSLAKQLKFDINYSGNAFREDTDFVIRAKAIGSKIFFNPFVVQFNLPRYMASGGAHSMSILKYRLNCLKNNWYFLNKNRSILLELDVTKSVYTLQMIYFFETIFHIVAYYTPSNLKSLIKKGILNESSQTNNSCV